MAKYAYNEIKYEEAVDALAKQLVAMAQEDYDDEETQRFATEEYTADAIQDITSRVKELLS